MPAALARRSEDFSRLVTALARRSVDFSRLVTVLARRSEDFPGLVTAQARRSEDFSRLFAVSRWGAFMRLATALARRRVGVERSII